MLVRGIIKDAAGIPYFCIHKHYDNSISEGEAIIDIIEILIPEMDKGDSYHVKIFESDTMRVSYLD